MSEQSKEPELQKSETEKGVIVPNEIAHAFAAGIRQLLKKQGVEKNIDPLTMAINSNKQSVEWEDEIAQNIEAGCKIEAVRLNKTRTEWEDEMINDIKVGYKAFRELIYQLEHSREIRIVSFSGGFDFKFLPRQIEGEIKEKEEINPKDGTLTLDSNLMPMFIHAFFHRYGNAFYRVINNSSNLDHVSKNPDVKQRAKTLYSSSLELEKTLKPWIKLLSSTEEFQIETKEGKTTITPISKPKIPSSL